MKHNKLVRDKIPEIIEKSGKKPVFTCVRDNVPYFDLLNQKLDEELAEYRESASLEELADVLEVIYALCEAAGYSVEDLQTIRQNKFEERGGFSKGVFLVEVKE